MKIVFSLIYCLLIGNVLYAETGKDELFAKLNDAASDSEKITTYNNIVSFFKYLNSDSAYYYAERGLEYAIRKNYLLGKAKMVYLLAQMDKNEGLVDIARERLDYALQLYQQENYQLGVAAVHSDLGAIECEGGNFDVGVKHFFTALKIQDSLKNYRGEMIAYMNIGSIYMQHEDTANASKYLTLASETSKRIPLEDATVSLYNTIGVFFIARGDTEKGLKTFLNNLEISDKPQFTKSHVECLMYLGNFYIDKRAPNKALPYLQKGLTLAREKKLREEEANLLLYIALLVKPTDTTLALMYLNQAKNICDLIQNKIFKVTVYDEMATLYKENNNFKEALHIIEQKQRLKDSLYTISKAKEIASLGAISDLEKSNLRVNQLESLSDRTTSQRNATGAVAVIIIITLIIFLYFYRRTVILNRKLVIHEKELEELNSMKDKLFSVIGHDLRGPIARIPAILDIYEDKNTDEEEKKFLFTSLREHTKSSLETFDKLLYWGLSLVKGIRIHQVKMLSKGYIKESIELRKLKAVEKNITIVDKTPPDLFVFADPTHFDFIIRNLLANALKYTYRDGLVEISADTYTKPGFTIFAVKDDGMGIDKAVLPKLFNSLKSSNGTEDEKGNGIGLMLCKEFAVQNGGDIWAESEPGKGATFLFSVKNSS